MTSSWSTSAARATPARSSVEVRRGVRGASSGPGGRSSPRRRPRTISRICASRSAADKLTLFGVSYGAKVAAEYARRYPDRTAALVLDSPVPVDGLDAFGQLRMLGAPAGAAGGLHPRSLPPHGRRPGRDARRGRRAGSPGSGARPARASSGRVDGLAVTESIVLALLVASDTSPGAAGGAAGRAGVARRGRRGAAAPPHAGHPDAAAPATSTGAPSGHALHRDPVAVDAGVRGRDAPGRARRVPGGADGGVRALPPGDARRRLDRRNCARPGRRPRGPSRSRYAGPDVPVLILSGRDDLRTPLEDARRTRGAVPEREAARRAGRRSLGAALRPHRLRPRRADRVPARADGRAVRAARPRARRRARTPRPRSAHCRPTRLAGCAAARSARSRSRSPGSRSTPRRTGRETFRLPGLRAGYVRGTRRTLRLHNVEWIRGVRISGRLDSRGRGTLSISGRGRVGHRDVQSARRERDARRAILHALKSAAIERPRALGVLVHEARPVGHDPAVLVAVPGVAARPRRAGEPRLQLAVARGLDVRRGPRSRRAPAPGGCRRPAPPRRR